MGNLSVWDPVKRKKLGTFKTTNATIEARPGYKLVKIKEERGLLQRFIVISRSRPDLDLKKCIGTFEFVLVPRSVLTLDGSLLLAYDKTTILHRLQKDATSQGMETKAGNQTTNSRVIIFDSMALMNSVSKMDNILSSFLEKLINLIVNYKEARLVFARYLNTSLKEQMRKKRTKGYYHVKDSSLIQNILLKDFLSNVKTKSEQMSRSQQESWQQVEEVHCDVWNRKQGKCPCSKHPDHSQSGGGRYCALAACPYN